MTVPTLTDRNIYDGTGSTTVFPYTFQILQDSDMAVSLIDADGVETVLTLSTDYTVSGAGSESGGNVTFVVAPEDGVTVLLLRLLPYTQPTDYKNQGSFYPRTHERSFDRATMQIQQVKAGVDRSMRLPDYIEGVSTVLPVPAASNLIGWDAAATGLRNFSASEIGTTLAFSNFIADTFTASAAQTDFTLTADPGNLANLDVSIDGVTQVPGTDYTVAGTTLTFAVTMAGGEKVLARYGTALPTGITDASSVNFLQAGAGAVTRTMQNKMRDGEVAAEDFGAAGDGVADDTAALLAAVTAANVRLVKGKTYRLTSRITVPDGRSISGDRTSVISMDTGAGFFDNTNQALYDAADSLAFLFDGNTGGGLFGFRIRLSNRTAELAAMAVLLRECDSVRVEGCEFDNFSKTKIVRIESSVDCDVDDNYFHDCQISSSTTGQLTCVDIDDVRPAGGSARISICDNVFKNITASAGFITSFGYQTDAINVSHEESDGHRICGNRIHTVGEGIDTFGANSVISGNLIQDAYAYGIKLVHGARRNVVEGNRIIDPGLGGIVLQGNTADTNHTEFNTVRCNHISGVNKAGNWAASTNFGIRCEDDGGTKYARNNIIRDNDITDGAAMKYGILSGNSSTGNQFRNNYVESFTIAEFDASGAASTYDFKSAKMAEVSAYQGASQSASGAYQTVNYDTETLDRTGEYNPATETYTATCPRKLLVTACWRTGGTTDLAVWDAQVRKNGSATRHTQTVARSSDLSVLISDVVEVVAGDTITVAMRTSTGTPALTNVAEFTNLRITEVR